MSFDAVRFARASGLGPAAVTWPALLLLAALLATYVPTFYTLLHGLWATDQNGHGPIVLAVSLWFLYYRASRLPPEVPVVPAPAWGWPVLTFGMALFIVGRSQEFYLFEVGSLVFVMIGLTLLLFGLAVARYLWFAFFFMCFMVPMPGSLVDALTQPMKIAVSWGTDQLLHALGYPISRSGVVLAIGNYQLLVADACAGLNSLFTLEALGLLYMNVMRHESPLRNFTLAALIVPISFASNLIRVVTLCLITYYLGDEAGQGFLHGFSGMVLFLSALMLIVGLDSLLKKVAERWDRRKLAA